MPRILMTILMVACLLTTSLTACRQGAMTSEEKGTRGLLEESQATLPTPVENSQTKPRTNH